MKKLFILFTILLSVLCMPGCGGTEETVYAEEGPCIYYLNAERTRLIGKSYEPEGDTTEELIVEYIQMLERIPDDPALSRAKPDEISLLFYAFGEDGQLQIYFDSGYYTMSGIDEVLYRAAFVKTLTQIDEIEYVEFYVNEQPLLLKGEVPVGLMKAEDFINNVGEGADYLQMVYCTLYFASADGTELEEVTVKVEVEEEKTDELLVLETLIAGPAEGQEFLAVLPEGTVINSVVTKAGVCYIDFNSKFLSALESVSGEIKVYSVVNSITELPEINAVQITVDGVKHKNVQGVNISGLLERRLDIVKGGT